MIIINPQIIPILIPVNALYSVPNVHSKPVLLVKSITVFHKMVNARYLLYLTFSILL